jgi:hypothetical protein
MTPVTQRTVAFYDDELIAIQDPTTNAIYVPLTRLCDNLSIVRARQAQRISEHPVLTHGFATMLVESSGGSQEAQCLRIDMIPLWLVGVNANRVKPEIRDKLIRYQTEVADVLWQAFKQDLLPATLPAPPEQPASGVELALDVATAIQQLAQQQVRIERSVEGMHDRMDDMARFLRNFVSNADRRVSALELQINPEEQLTEAQAGELALAVKAVAQALSGPDRTTNGYQHVYAELAPQISAIIIQAFTARQMGGSHAVAAPVVSRVNTRSWLKYKRLSTLRRKHCWRRNVLGMQHHHDACCRPTQGANPCSSKNTNTTMMTTWCRTVMERLHVRMCTRTHALLRRTHSVFTTRCTPAPIPSDAARSTLAVPLALRCTMPLDSTSTASPWPIGSSMAHPADHNPCTPQLHNSSTYSSLRGQHRYRRM